MSVLKREVVFRTSGTARWLPSSTASSPSTSRTAAGTAWCQSVQGPAGIGQTRCSTGFGLHRLIGPLMPGCPGVAHRRRQVVHVNPCKPLLPAADRSTHTGLEGGNHLGHGAAASAQDDPQAHEHDPAAFFRSPQCFTLPIDGKPGEEIAPRRFVFGDELITAVAVIPDPGGADEGGRTRGADPPPRCASSGCGFPESLAW
jgi:hypothetical protein